jgi:hypothetical protein
MAGRFKRIFLVTLAILELVSRPYLLWKLFPKIDVTLFDLTYTAKNAQVVAS